MLDNSTPSLIWLAASSEKYTTTPWNWWTVESRYCRMFFEEDIRSILAISIVGSQKQLQLNVFPHASKHMLCKKLIVWPVNWLTKTTNFSGKILNKVHLHHNLCNMFALFHWAVYPSVWTLLTNVCYKKKVLNAFDSSSTYSASTDPWWTICILHSSTDHHCHSKTVPSGSSGACKMNLWTVFTMEAIVLVSVLTSSAKYMI